MCKERFTSYEQAKLNYPRINKSDGRRGQFNEDKLRVVVLRALEKRPVDMEQIKVAISHIKHKLRTVRDRGVKSRKMVDLAMEESRILDQVAYVRFISVYRSFEDVKAFLEEIE